MPRNLKNKFAVMSYNIKLENFLDYCKPTNKIKVRKEHSIILSRERCLTVTSRALFPV